MIKVQIYSLTSVADAVATAEAGADLIGIVVGQVATVPEEIPADRAREILKAVSGRALGVALSLSVDRNEICKLVARVSPDIVHLPMAALTVEDIAWIREQIAPVKTMRAIAVSGSQAVTEAASLHECADYLLLDSPDSSGKFAGATGQTHDWQLSRRIVLNSKIPAILAGGLSPENVAEAIATVRPWGVDSFTRTDKAGQRGVKDLARVRAFISAARAAQEHLGS